VRAAYNDKDILERLTLLAYFHPKLRGYCERNLCDTRQWWAECYTCWDFSAGVQYSTVAELWFLSIESVLDGTTVPLTGALDLMRRVVKKRHEVTYEPQAFKLSTRTFPKLFAFLKDQGYKDILDNIFAYIGECIWL